MMLASAIATSIGAPPPPTVTFGPAVRVNPEGVVWTECAIAASQINDNEAAVIATTTDPLRGIAASINGFATFGVYPHPPFRTSTEAVSALKDPFAVSVRGSGRIWLGGLRGQTQGGSFAGINYANKEAGDTDWTSGFAIAGTQGVSDKPFMAVGPDPTLSSTMYYVTYNDQTMTACDSTNAQSAQVTGDAFLNTWTKLRIKPDTPDPETGDVCDYGGWGSLPVVTDSGVVVVTVLDRYPAVAGKYNARKPYVVFSDSAGAHWWPNNSAPNIPGFGMGVEACPIWSDGPIGDFSPKVDRRKCAPTIAVDRSKSPNWVYVAYYARSEAGHPLTEDRNADLYIFRSVDGGLTFANEGVHGLHMTDAMLGVAPGGLIEQGPDQIVPAMTIDCTGAVNLIYYDNRNDPSPGYDSEYFDVYHTRITDFKQPTMQITTTRLTPSSFPAEMFLGDYQTLAPAGPTGKKLYAAYIAREPVGSGWSSKNCYVRKITINLCAADLNGNGFAEGGDAESFSEAVSTSSPTADLNEDGQIDTDDLETFVWSYESMNAE
ncbi:MAG: hypothetical protein JNL50_04535 [Phycisphaerae bacterium]|nr:hypothetical protein [Phycisphaerae bacterium]